MNFSDKLKFQRNKRNITQKDLANALKYTTTVIGAIENNSRKPSKKIAMKLAEYFKTPVEYWLYEDFNIDKRVSQQQFINEILAHNEKYNINVNFKETNTIINKLIAEDIITHTNIYDLNSNINDILLIALKKDINETLQSRVLKQEMEKLEKNQEYKKD